MSSDNVYLFSEREIELEMERLLDIAKEKERNRFIRILKEEHEKLNLGKFGQQVDVDCMVTNILQKVKDGYD